MIGRATAWFFTHARDAIARRLVRIGVTPNMLTVAGTVLTVGTGVCLAAGVAMRQDRWFLLAGVLLYSCFACDMLDGAVARLGGGASEFGAFLDSTLDRVSDFAIYIALAVGYAWRAPANLTFLLLALLALLSAQLISYAKARAEDFIDDCTVGYWQRGERCAAVLIACFACNPGALVLQQALSPTFTVWRRVWFTRQSILHRRAVRDVRAEGSWFQKLQPWMYPRKSLPYDLITLANIAFLIFFRFDASQWDLLRTWLR